MKRCLLLALMLGAAAAHAQLADEDVDWQDRVAVKPPAFDTKNLIPIDGLSGNRVRFGIDPKTIQVTPDGVVRYVMVAQTDTAMNVSYEGIYCKRLDWRVYARHLDGHWSAREGDWKPLSDAPQHARTAARAGLCDVRTAPFNADAAVRALRAPLKTY